MRKRGATVLAVAACAVLGIGTAARAVDDDATFVKKVATGGMLEVELGKYAEKNAADAGVREFARQMVEDHTAANEQLTALATKSGLVVPKALDDEHQKEADKLMREKGAAFDEAYMKKMIVDHKTTVEAFQAQADQKQTEVDRWAAKTLPTLENHLAHAKSVEERLGKTASSQGHGSGNMAGDSGRM